jgi:ABC-type antimicrobial peptide transport system permease subunit
VFPTPTTAKGGPTTGAAGMLVYSPHAPLTLSPRQLIAEFALEIVESLLLAGALALVAGGFGARFGAAALVGLVAAVTTNLSYWNWYGFPLDYTLATGFTELMKYVVAGLVIALVLSRRKAAPA